MKQKYEVIQASSADELSKLVDIRLGTGWSLLGGISVVNKTRLAGIDFYVHELQFSQAMLLVTTE